MRTAQHARLGGMVGAGTLVMHEDKTPDLGALKKPYGVTVDCTKNGLACVDGMTSRAAAGHSPSAGALLDFVGVCARTMHPPWCVRAASVLFARYTSRPPGCRQVNEAELTATRWSLNACLQVRRAAPL